MRFLNNAINIKKKRYLYNIYIYDFLAFPKKVVLKNSLRDVQIMLLTIGFPRAGSSLLGYLLTAHSNIVIADEAPYIDKKIKLKTNLDGIFCYILNSDYNLWLEKLRLAKVKKKLSSRNRTKVVLRRARIAGAILILNQHQGSFKQLNIIGNKASVRNMKFLNNNPTLEMLKNTLKKRNIAMKLILTVRNPYDMYATRTRFSGSDTIGTLLRLSKKSEKLLKQTDSRDIFIARHENMVADPRSELAKICDFLQVPASPDYLDDCASVVNKKPHKSRYECDWTEDEKQAIASLTEKYDFFSGYDWHT